MPPTYENSSSKSAVGINSINQEKQLQEAKIAVKTDSLLMKKALDKLDLLEGIKHASDMLNKLGNIARINNTEVMMSLSPKNYYDLYIDVTDELRHLETFMIDEFQKGLKCDDLYELVQYASSIIPRLYLLITVGTAYIKIKEYPSKIILRDLVEMCRGVQHPLRGLFLRNYLLQCTKSLLPDLQPVVGGAEEQDGNINDSIEFILFNFSEMNKLWVRMQYQGHTSIQFNSQVSKELIKMLKIPIDLHKNVLILLKLKHFSTLYDHLDYTGRKSICHYILNNALDNETCITTPDEVESLLELLNPVIEESTDKPNDYEEDNEDFVDEQTLVARLIHLMNSENLDEQFMILNAARKKFGKNAGKERMKYTLPPLIFKAYELAFRYKEAAEEDDKWEKKCDKIFKFCFQTINALIKAELPAELPFRIFLKGSIAPCQIAYENCENITYEFISQAIALYDDEIATNKYNAITLIVGTCQKILHIFEEENCDSLRQNCVTRAAKLLKKPDQCRAVGLCTNLFWNCEPRKDGTSLKDGKKVNECLRKCLKIAAQCVDTNAQFELHVEILNYYMYFFEAKNDQITLEMLGELIAKIKQDVEEVDKNSEKQMLVENFNRTLDYLKKKSKSDDSCFNSINL